MIVDIVYTSFLLKGEYWNDLDFKETINQILLGLSLYVVMGVAVSRMYFVLFIFWKIYDKIRHPLKLNEEEMLYYTENIQR